MAGIAKVNLNLDNIPKDKIYQGKKGKYLGVTITINDEPDQFGNHGSVVVEQTKEERAAKAPKTYLGNCKVLWTNGTFPDRVPSNGAPAPQVNTQSQDEDLPF